MVFYLKLLLYRLFLDCPSTLAYRAYLYSALHGIEVYGTPLNSLMMETMSAAAEIAHGRPTHAGPGSTQSGPLLVAELKPSIAKLIAGSSLKLI
jgi:hypothetical protein